MARRQYTEDEKAVALAYYEATRNLRGTARECSVPVPTLQRWIRGEGVSSAVRKSIPEKRQAIEERVDELVHHILDLAPGAAEDAPFKDLMVGLGIAVDKRQVLRGEPTSITHTTEDHRSLAVELYCELTGASVEAVRGALESGEGD